jgi:hypothetical protein
MDSSRIPNIPQVILGLIVAILEVNPKMCFTYVKKLIKKIMQLGNQLKIYRF